MNPRRLFPIVAVTLALATVTAGAAAAARPSPLVHAADAGAAQTSSNWAGYAVTGSRATPTSYTNVAGSWTQPTATCTSGGRAFSAFWVGLGGYSDSSRVLEQIGTEADCSASGTPTYTIWYEVVPSPPVTVNLPLQPGDAISASVAVSGSSVTFQIANTTRGASFAKTVTVASPDTSSAEWIAESPSNCGDRGGCRPLPLANFGTVTFTGASVTGNGHAGTITDAAWTVESVTLQGSSLGRFRGRFGSLVPAAGAVPGALSSDGSSFSISWRQESATSSGRPSGREPGWGRGRGPGRGWGRGWDY